MASETYSDVWRRVRLHVPAAPTFLVREWVQHAWKAVARSRHWAFLRGEGRLTLAAARTLGSVTVTSGSPTVTSAGLFLAADAGRQFRIASPTVQVYTVQTFTDVNTLQLDAAYGDASGVVGATIYDGFAVMPLGFESFRLIADPYNERRLAFWITEDQLNILDPNRMASDTGPRLLATRAPSRYTPTLGQPCYEYWPRPTAARSYPYLYNQQASRLLDSTTFTGVLADAADVLVDGALAEAARWPGTGVIKNPYFDTGIARDKKIDFSTGIQKLSLRDDDQYPDDLAKVHWERWPLADLAYNDQALRATDASVADLY